jgi:hypothetical protein
MEDKQRFEEQFNQDLSRVRSFLSSNVRSQTTLRECDRLLSSAQRCAAALEQIAEESGDSFQMADAKKRTEQEINPLLQEIERAKSQRETSIYDKRMNLDRERNDLFGGYKPPTGSNDDVEMLIRNSEELLLDSQRLVYESEAIGDETLGLMGRQGDQLRNANSHITSTIAALTQAKVILQETSRKASRNKRFLKTVIAILILANGIVLYAITKKKSRK